MTGPPAQAARHGAPVRRAVLGESGPRGRLTRPLLGLMGVATVFVGWWLGSVFTGFVPPVLSVLVEFPAFISDEYTLYDVRLTWVRVMGSLAAATVLGFGLAVVITRLSGLGPVVERMVSALLGVPSTIAALLTLFVFRRAEIGVYVVVVVITLPFIVVIFVSGLRDLQHRLDEMAMVYGLGSWARLRHVVAPQLVPHLFVALRNEHGHAWKVAVLAEVFAVGHGMGASFSRAFDRFILPEVMLWLLAFVVVLLATEYGALRPLERAALRWRRS